MPNARQQLLVDDPQKDDVLSGDDELAKNLPSTRKPTALGTP
jgi:hypothetical protein